MIYKQCNCNISEVTTYDDCTEQAYKDQLDQGVGASEILADILQGSLNFLPIL